MCAPSSLLLGVGQGLHEKWPGGLSRHIYPPGTWIGDRYEVAGMPLMGGMGIVYLCHDREEDRPVALKTFKPEYLPDRATRDRLLREADTWAG